MTCTNCGNTLSRFDVNCRKCGHPVEKPTLTEQLEAVDWSKQGQGREVALSMEVPTGTEPTLAGFAKNVARVIGGAAGAMAAETASLASDSATMGFDRAVDNMNTRANADRIIRRSRSQ